MLATRVVERGRFTSVLATANVIRSCQRCHSSRSRGWSSQAKGANSRKDEPTEDPPPERETWMLQKDALKTKFGEEGWRPRKRLSPDAIEGIRSLHAQDPETYSTPYLASHFEVSPEAIRRILKSKWQPSAKEDLKRRERWERRGQSVWSRWAELGFTPPKKWKAGIGGNESKMASEVGNVAKTHAKRPRGKGNGDSSLSSRIL